MKKQRTIQLIPETPFWSNRAPKIRAPVIKQEKRYRTRDLFQSDLF